MKSNLALLTFTFLLAMQTACTQTNGNHAPNNIGQYSNQIILDWNLAAFEAMGGAAIEHTLLSSRVNAITHLAIYDALNAIEPRYQPYAFHQKNKEADPVAAVATAAYEVLVNQIPAKKSMLDDRLAASLAAVPEGNAKTQGIELGKQAAEAILTLRKNDGAFENPVTQLAASNQAGVYEVVPPFNFLFAPFWKTMQTFSLEKPEQFRVEPYPDLASQAYTDNFNEVKRIGQKDSQHRSAEQTAIAKFWYEYSDIGWNRVTRTVATDKKLDILATARLFALVNMAMADSYISGWDSKFHYNFWRPYTAIRAAQSDGNDNTAADPNWESLMPNPPVQDYPSTHSILGNAAATVLTAIVGDNVPFTMTSTTAETPGSTRSFNSFLQAADENAESRVLAGIHFRFSCKKGQELGNKVGKWTLEHHLKPLN